MQHIHDFHGNSFRAIFYFVFGSLAISRNFKKTPFLIKNSLFFFRSNLLENHTGLILCSLLKTELPDALVKVIVTSKPELSILATVLLGEILHMAHVYLPRELNATSHCLPTLLAEVSSTDPIRSNRASEAVDALQRLHDLKKRGPVASSLFLDQIMTGSGVFTGESFVGDRLNSPNWNELLKKSSDERVLASVRESQVGNTSCGWNDWNWELITAVFKWPSESFKQLDAHSEFKTFIRRVVDFYKPSGGQFYKIELVNKKTRCLAKAGCYILDFLLNEPSSVSNADSEVQSTDPRLDFVSRPRLTSCWTTYCQIFKIISRRFLPRAPLTTASCHRRESPPLPANTTFCLSVASPSRNPVEKSWTSIWFCKGVWNFYVKAKLFLYFFVFFKMTGKRAQTVFIC